VNFFGNGITIHYDYDVACGVVSYVLGQLLVFLSDLAYRIVFAQICILLYYWANKMMMMMMMIQVDLDWYEGQEETTACR